MRKIQNQEAEVMLCQRKESESEHAEKLARMPLLQGLHDRAWILKHLERHPDSRILRKWLYEDVCAAGIELKDVKWI